MYYICPLFLIGIHRTNRDDDSHSVKYGGFTTYLIKEGKQMKMAPTGEGNILSHFFRWGKD